MKVANSYMVTLYRDSKAVEEKYVIARTVIDAIAVIARLLPKGMEFQCKCTEIKTG